MYKIISKKALRIFLFVFIVVFLLFVEFILQRDRGINVSTEKSRENFLSDMGIVVSAESLVTNEVYIPEEFNAVFENYNDLQKRAGYNLEEYKGRKITKYTYEVLNFDSGDTVVVSILAYRNKVIGGDISSTALDGFVLPLDKGSLNRGE